MLAAAQALFVNLLKNALHTFAPHLDAASIIAAGATSFDSVVPPESRPAVLKAYNQAITHTFYLAVGLTGMALTTSLGLGTLKIGPKKEASTESPSKAEEAK